MSEHVLGDGTVVKIVFPPNEYKIMMERHFRYSEKRVSGNFFRWTNPKALIENRVIAERLLEEVLEAEDGDVNSFEINLPAPVGWEQTEDLNKFALEMLELFQPNKRSSALKIKDRSVLASLTNIITITFAFNKTSPYDILVEVYSVHPGIDYGPLKNNITSREGRVFFDLNHPGEALI